MKKKENRIHHFAGECPADILRLKAKKTAPQQQKASKNDLVKA